MQNRLGKMKADRWQEPLVEQNTTPILGQSRTSSVIAYLDKQNRAVLIGAAILFVLILGLIDYESGYELSFSIFYVAPIAFVTWFAGRGKGLILAGISGLVWLAADIATGHEFSRPFILVWNAGVRLSFFAIIVTVLAQLKLAYQAQVRLVDELRAASEKVKILSGLIPICAWCKKIRDDQGYWQQVETYITQHSEASFTHGICPECKREMDKDIPNPSRN